MSIDNQLSRLWGQIEHDLGFNDHNMRRDRPYNGQPAQPTASAETVNVPNEDGGEE